MLLHLLFSTFLWMPSYYTKLWDQTDIAVVPIVNGTKLDKFGMMKPNVGGTPAFPTGLQVVFDDTTHHYDTANGTVLSTWPVAGAMKVKSAAGPLNATHPLEMLTTVTNIITLRSKLNWIGESSTLLGIVSGEQKLTVAGHKQNPKAYLCVHPVPSRVGPGECNCVHCRTGTWLACSSTAAQGLLTGCLSDGMWSRPLKILP